MNFGSSWIRLQTAGQSRRGHHARRPCPFTSAVAGRSTRSWGCRERWKDRSAAGGHPHFFQRHLSRLSTPRLTIPASPDARSREPSPRARPPRTLPAFLRAQASQDRASGLRGVRLRCACGRPSAQGQGRGWRDRYLPKNADGPLPRFHPSAVADASTHAWRNPRLPACPDTIPLHRGSSRPCRE
jgi:hypothetical protein